MNRPIDQLTKALQVITLDPAIRRFLEKTDPQALQQAEEALRNYYNQFEDATHFSDFELR
jgi:hypothetical protein